MSIQFTSEGKILFNDGQIVFNCDCCDCAWCNDGFGVAGDTVRVTFNFNGTALGAGSGSPSCSDCLNYATTAYDLTKIDTDSKCSWSGPGECGHIITLFHTTGLDGSFLVLAILSSDGNTTYASWRYTTSFGSDFFNCTDNDGTLLFSSSMGSSFNGFFTSRPCVGTGEALVDYLL